MLNNGKFISKRILQPKNSNDREFILVSIDNSSEDSQMLYVIET